MRSTRVTNLTGDDSINGSFIPFYTPEHFYASFTTTFVDSRNSTIDCNQSWDISKLYITKFKTNQTKPNARVFKSVPKYFFPKALLKMSLNDDFRQPFSFF